MAKPLRVIALRADAGGCAHYRIEQPALATRIHIGIDVSVETSLAVDAERDREKFATVHRVLEDADVLVFQRPLDNAFTKVIEQAQKQGIACVVELDDDFSTIHPDNMAYSGVQPANMPWSNYEHIERAAELADLVTVSTDALTKYAPHGRYEVIRNFVGYTDTLIKPVTSRRNSDGTPWTTTVGWSGTLLTHPHDLQESRPGAAQAIRDAGARFYVVGDGSGVQAALGLPKTVPFRDSGWVPRERYLEKVASSIDIGIVPLEDSAFNRAKSWLKGLEFAALGIPFVASPLPEYVKLHEEYGIGVLAPTPSAWRRELRRMIDNLDEWRETASDWQTTIRRQLTYDANFDKWHHAWTRALAHRNPARYEELYNDAETRYGQLRNEFGLRDRAVESDERTR